VHVPAQLMPIRQANSPGRRRAERSRTTSINAIESMVASRTRNTDTTYLVAAESVGPLTQELQALGVTLDASAARASEASAAPAGATASAAGEPVDALVAGLSTRRTRERLEEAIAAGHDVELRYAVERERYGRYGPTTSGCAGARRNRAGAPRPAHGVRRPSGARGFECDAGALDNPRVLWFCSHVMNQITNGDRQEARRVPRT